MKRKLLIASLLAAGLALAPATHALAAPDSEDYAKILLGLLAVGAIVNALENQRERERAAERARNRPAEWRGHDRPRQGRGGDRWLPARCAFDVRTGRGWSSVFGRACLEREGVRVSRLPDRCAFDVRTERGRRVVYGEECLIDHGFRVEAGRR
jgi:hypothetical protein